MKNNKSIFRIGLVLLIVISVFLSPTIYASEGGVINTMVTLVESILVRLTLHLGDGLFFFVSKSVGEIVSIDAIVYNCVDKLNINYWGPGSGTAVKTFFKGVIEKWYDAFFGIAIIVYMMVLIVAGIQILLHSTAEKTAQYKEYIVSWVTGVAILFFFPYAMKYIVMLNETAIIAIRGESYTPTISSPAFLQEDWQTANDTFGKPEFVEKMTGGAGTVNGSMLKIRELALTNKKFSLVIIYFIMIGQSLVLLMMYYKRVFMMAFLITIFPLVAMTFAIDKMGDKKAQSFGIWFKEFVVNVVVQIFHATVYSVLVSACVNSFVASNGEDWLFMILSQFFLFQGEKILRSIFEIKSKANTIGDLAASAAIFDSMRKELKNHKANNVKDVGSKQDTADDNAIDARNEARGKFGVPPPTYGAVAAREATEQADSGSGGESDNNSQEQNRMAPFDASAAMDTVVKGASKNRLRSGIASGLAKRGVNVMGGVLGATYAMSKGDTNGEMYSNMISDGYAGTKIARGLLTPATSAINVAERRISGELLAARIESGAEDGNLGLDATGLDIVVETPPADVDIDEVVDKHGVTTQEVYRQALAEMARATAKGGRAKGEEAFWKSVEKSTKK